MYFVLSNSLIDYVSENNDQQIFTLFILYEHLYQSAAPVLFYVSSSSFASSLQLDTAATSSSNRVRHNNLVVLLSSYALFDHLNERISNLHSFFGRCFEIGHAVVFFAPSSGFVTVNFPFRLSINLIAYKNERE